MKIGQKSRIFGNHIDNSWFSCIIFDDGREFPELSQAGVSLPLFPEAARSSCPGPIYWENLQMKERLVIPYVGKTLQIDENGRVWRIGRYDEYGNLYKVALYRCERNATRGYLTVRENKITCLAHRLVCYYFHGEIPEGMDVHHRNRIRNDNRPENLLAVDANFHRTVIHRTFSFRKWLRRERKLRKLLRKQGFLEE